MLDCNIVITEFELQSCYRIHFRANALRKGINTLIFFIMGLIVPLLFFCMCRFGIKQPTKVNMPLNKEGGTNK